MTKNISKVCILLASFNGERYIKQQLISILNQKKIKLDIFISDDASTDSTVNIINSFIKKYSNISLLPFRNSSFRSPGANFYYLLTSQDFSKYDYIALSDQDDIWPEHKLSRAVSLLRNSQYDGYSSDFLIFNDDTHLTKYFKKSNQQTAFDFIFETPGPGCSFVLNQKLAISLQVFLKNNNVDSFKYHDWLIYAFARSNNFCWYIDKSPNLFYRQHNHNFMGSNTSFYGFLKRLMDVFSGRWTRDIGYINNMFGEKRSLWFYLIFFYKTRRSTSHKFLMLFFLFYMALQK